MPFLSSKHLQSIQSRKRPKPFDVKDVSLDSYKIGIMRYTSHQRGTT